MISDPAIRDDFDEGLDLYLVPLDVVISYINPLQDDPWGCGLTLEMVNDAIEDRAYHPAPVEYGEEDPMVHAMRIAWLVENGWQDEIVFDVGVTPDTISKYPITDGNHRLAAAILREDTHILICPDGDLDIASKLFDGYLVEPDIGPEP